MVKCIKSCEFSLSFYHFFYNIIVVIALKITMKYIFIVFFSPSFLLVALIKVVNLVIFCVPEIRIVKIRRIFTWSSILFISGAPADHDTQTCYLGHKSNKV